MSWRTEDRFLGLDLLLEFAGWPTVHHNYIYVSRMVPYKYIIRIGSTSGRQIGNAEKIHPGSRYGPFRFTPLEEAREFFKEVPMERRTMEGLKEAIAGELRECARNLAVELRQEANRLEAKPHHLRRRA